MIVKTPRSALYTAVDTVLTTLAWIAFFYLCISGIPSIVRGKIHGLAVPLASNLLPAVHTLLSYLLVSIVIAALLFAWARYNALHFGRRQRRHPLPEASMERLAASFEVTLPQLLAIQESRRIVVHHSPEGRITDLEGDAAAKPYRPVDIPWPIPSSREGASDPLSRPVLH